MFNPRQSSTALTLDGLVLDPPQVAPVVQQIHRFHSELETVFAMLAERLPPLADNVQKLQERLGNFKNSQRAGTLSETVVETRSLADLFKQELTDVLTLNTGVLSAAGQLSEAVESIVSTLDGIDKLSWKLGLTGLNASVTAAHTGEEGLAFAALTRELTLLTEVSADEARRLRQVSLSIHQEATSLLGLQRDSESALNGLAEKSQHEVDEAVQVIHHALQSVVTQLQAAEQNGEQVLGAIRKVMMTVQRQDILRQGIEHLGVVLSEVQNEFGALQRTASDSTGELGPQIINYLVFQERVGSLGGRLWADLAGELEQLIGDVLTPLNQASSTGKSLASCQSSLGPGLERQLNEPTSKLGKTLTHVRQLTDVFTQYGEIAQKLSQLTQTIPSSLTELENLARHLRIINVLIKIEVARTSALSRASTIATEIDSAEERFNKFLANVESALRKLSQTLQLLDSAVAQVSACRAKLDDLSTQAAQHAERVRLAGTIFVEELTHLTQTGQSVNNSASDFCRRLEAFAKGIRDSNVVQSHCQLLAEMAQELEEQAQGLYGPMDLQNLSSPKLNELVERFTVLSHKQVAGSVIDMNVEKGDEGGELTLF